MEAADYDRNNLVAEVVLCDEMAAAVVEASFQRTLRRSN